MNSSDVFLEYIFWVLQFKKCIKRGRWSALKKNSYLFSIYIKLKYLYKIILCPLKIFSQTISWGGVGVRLNGCFAACYSAGGLYTLLSYMGFNWLYSCMYRAKMRQQYMLKESPTYDWFVHCCCEPCALCQEYRELENRGHDMTIGIIMNYSHESRFSLFIFFILSIVLDFQQSIFDKNKVKLRDKQSIKFSKIERKMTI